MITETKVNHTDYYRSAHVTRYGLFVSTIITCNDIYIDKLHHNKEQKKDIIHQLTAIDVESSICYFSPSETLSSSNGGPRK
jgi:hypothetical protein